MTDSHRVAGAIATVMVLAMGAACTSRAPSTGQSAGERAIERQVKGAASASPPFEGLTAAPFRVGDRTYNLVIADFETEREQGLRGRASIAPYDGMLFAFDATDEANFTMSGTVAPLEIAFYAADGSFVARRSMTPCAGTDATCPLYSADRPYRWAIETPGGQPTPDGRFSAP